jgi:hypothetical protein
VGHVKQEKTAEDIWDLTVNDLLTLAPPGADADDETLVPYVINLNTSAQPISIPSTSLGHLDSFHLYQVTGWRNSQLVFRLRLGPIENKLLAEALLPELLRDYPEAVATPALEDDIRMIAAVEATAAPRATKPKPPISLPVLTPQLPRPAPAVKKSAAADQSLHSVAANVLAPAAVRVRPPAQVAVRPPAPTAPRPAARARVTNGAAVAAATPAPRAAAVPVAAAPAAPAATARVPTAPVAAAPAAPTPAAAPQASAPAVPAPAAAPVAAVSSVPAPAAPVVSAPAPSRVVAAPARQPAPAAAPSSSARRPIRTPAVPRSPAEVAAKPRDATRVAQAQPSARPAPTARQAPRVNGAAMRPAATNGATVVPPSIVPTVPQIPHVAPSPAAKRSPAPVRRPAPATTAPAQPQAGTRQFEVLPGPLPPVDATQTLRPLNLPDLQEPTGAEPEIQLDAVKLFVIQLALTESELDERTIPNLAIFNEYRLYSVMGYDNGKIMHALRLGFFQDRAPAEAVAGYLGCHFQNPAVKRVTVAEKERFADRRIAAKKDSGDSGTHAAIELRTLPSAPPTSLDELRGAGESKASGGGWRKRFKRAAATR